MSDILKPPQYHLNGLNILDPKDALGDKSDYITILQEKALMRYLPKGTGVAVDIGCGYGRLTSVVHKNGWRVIGVDPSD